MSRRFLASHPFALVAAAALLGGAGFAALAEGPPAPTPLEAAIARGDTAAVEALHGGPNDLGRAYNNSLALKEDRNADGTVNSVQGFGVRTINLRNLTTSPRLIPVEGARSADAPAAAAPEVTTEDAKVPTPLEAAIARGDMAAVEALHGTPNDLGRAYNISLYLEGPKSSDGTPLRAPRNLPARGVRTISLGSSGRTLILYNAPPVAEQPVAAPGPAKPEAQNP